MYIAKGLKLHLTLFLVSRSSAEVWVFRIPFSQSKSNGQRCFSYQALSFGTSYLFLFIMLPPSVFWNHPWLFTNHFFSFFALRYMCVCLCERERMCVCVRERERVSVCVHTCSCWCVYVFACVSGSVGVHMSDVFDSLSSKYICVCTQKNL